MHVHFTPLVAAPRHTPEQLERGEQRLRAEVAKRMARAGLVRICLGCYSALDDSAHRDHWRCPVCGPIHKSPHGSKTKLMQCAELVARTQRELARAGLRRVCAACVSELGDSPELEHWTCPTCGPVPRVWGTSRLVYRFLPSEPAQLGFNFAAPDPKPASAPPPPLEPRTEPTAQRDEPRPGLASTDRKRRKGPGVAKAGRSRRKGATDELGSTPSPPEPLASGEAVEPDASGNSRRAK